MVTLWSLCHCGFVLADDWPQWRGPQRNDVSKEAGLLTSWPDKGPPLAWTNNSIGIGYSAPAIVGDRLYILGTRGNTECAFAIDTATGEVHWTTDLGETLQWPGNNWGDGPRSTPTIDGDRLYALGSKGDLACLEIQTGKKLWAKNLFADFNGHVMDNNGKEIVGWGYCEGPLVDGDRLVVTPGGEGGLLLALNKMTGEVIWRSQEVKSEAPYSSIMPAEIGGVRQYVQMTLEGAVGIRAKDGKFLWTYPRPTDELIVRTPIVHQDFVFITNSFDSGSDLFLVKAADGAFQTEKVYANKNIKNAMGGVILLGDYLYGHSDRVGWVCQHFNKNKGALVWEEKRKLGKGSVTYADNHLYCFTEDDGIVALLEASPKGYKEKGRFTLAPQTKHRPQAGKLWTHPVVANGRLYLRDQDLLFCYDVRAAKN
jgi:outer membrane protein assembly factor BamB